MTYGQIGKILNISPRVIGFALKTNEDPLNIPCHRVVGSKGLLIGYAFGGIKKKKKLLENEGVRFVSSARVDLSQSLLSGIN